jgi:dTDP-4-dehydrorhamnose 3,5-epimerase
LPIAGVTSTDLVVHADVRGSFAEAFRQGWFEDRPSFVQGNVSRSAEGVLRGMHFHRRQSDLWVPLAGRFRIGLFDLRPDSPTARTGHRLEMDAERPQALLIPPGVAHGFLALSAATLLYLVTAEYDGTDEHGFRFDDPDLGFGWDVEAPILAERDRTAPSLAEVLAG